MKKTTIIFALILAVMMSLFSVGCNPAANTPNTPTTQGTPSEVTGTTFNAGNMSVLVPKGWCGVAVADSFNEFDSNTNPNQAYVAKGSNITTDMEVYEHPYILVMHIPADKTYYEPSPLM
ncbi:MAG: hypothetical protein IKX58_09040, partial [Clostridia bacterium]|nr:hypothetical protein [Clostridia bacterium]